MARTDTFNNWATDIADSIRTKTGETGKIPASEFDTKILAIQTGSKLQSKNLEVTDNGVFLIKPDEDYGGLSEATVSVSVGQSDLEITDGYYLFYQNHRVADANKLLPLCKNLTDTYYMFYSASNLDIPVVLCNGELDNLTNATSYKELMYMCSKVPYIKIASKSTKPSTMARMFYSCSSAETIDLTGMVYDNITTMEYMFYGCKQLKNFILGTDEFPKVTSLAYMLNDCQSLEEIDLSSKNFPLVANMINMFKNCKNATSIKLPLVKSIGSFNYVFYGCDKLQEIDFNQNDLTLATNVSYMFGSESTDKTIEGTLDLKLSELGFDFSRVSTKTYFLTGNKCIRTIDLMPFDGVTFTKTELVQWFNNASSLIEIDLAPIHTSGITSLNQLFTNCIRLKKILNFDKIDGSNLSGITAIYAMFSGCESLEEINLSNLNTSKVTTGTSNNQSTTGFCNLFANCKSLRTLDISNFVINSAVTHLVNMFAGCEKLKTLLLPDFKTGNIMNTSYMFYGCSELGNVDASKFPVNTITNFSGMFSLSGVENVIFPTVETPISKGFSMTKMFEGCTNLKKVDLSFLGRNTNGSGAMTYMFADCVNLEEVDLSNYYNMSSSGQAQYMFKNCKKLKTVKLHHVPGEYIANREGYWSGCNGMFDGCESLEVLDLRYFCWIATQQTGYGSYMFRNCRKLRKLDLRGTNYGQLGQGNSSWNSGTTGVFENCGVDNDSPTIVYVSDPGCQGNIISLGNKFGLGWSAANVILVTDPEQEVDMS